MGLVAKHHRRAWGPLTTTAPRREGAMFLARISSIIWARRKFQLPLSTLDHDKYRNILLRP
jgi:hypothetical protein